ncbi:MAG: histidine phosphatase family protein [Crocinitomicaceae bacterium]
MKLFLMRHGKAIEAIENQRDFDRGLAKKGKRQSKKMGEFLKNSDIDYALVSSAKRTVETFDEVNRVLQIDEVYESQDLYLATAHQISEVLNSHITHKNVLLVGHNYGISEVVDYYTGIDVQLGTGHIAIIEFDVQSSAHFSKFSGRLIEVVSPKNL